MSHWRVRQECCGFATNYRPDQPIHAQYIRFSKRLQPGSSFCTLGETGFGTIWGNLPVRFDLPVEGGKLEFTPVIPRLKPRAETAYGLRVWTEEGLLFGRYGNRKSNNALYLLGGREVLRLDRDLGVYLGCEDGTIYFSKGRWNPREGSVAAIESRLNGVTVDGALFGRRKLEDSNKNETEVGAFDLRTEDRIEIEGLPPILRPVSFDFFGYSSARIVMAFRTLEGPGRVAVIDRATRSLRHSFELDKLPLITPFERGLLDASSDDRRGAVWRTDEGEEVWRVYDEESRGSNRYFCDGGERLFCFEYDPGGSRLHILRTEDGSIVSTIEAEHGFEWDCSGADGFIGFVPLGPRAVIAYSRVRGILFSWND